jgi:hypothetical protein
LYYLKKHSMRSASIKSRYQETPQTSCVFWTNWSLFHGGTKSAEGLGANGWRRRCELGVAPLQPPDNPNIFTFKHIRN